MNIYTSNVSDMVDTVDSIGTPRPQTMGLQGSPGDLPVLSGLRMSDKQLIGSEMCGIAAIMEDEEDKESEERDLVNEESDEINEPRRNRRTIIDTARKQSDIELATHKKPVRRASTNTRATTGGMIQIEQSSLSIATLPGNQKLFAKRHVTIFARIYSF